MSISHERRVKGYLKPSQHNFITKYIEVYKVSESSAVNQAVKALQDAMPKDILEKIMKGSPSKNGY